MPSESESTKVHHGTDSVGYLNPTIPSDVGVTEIPIVRATEASLKDVGCLFDDPQDFTAQSGRFEIVPWPQPGWRQLDAGTGIEGGTTEGDFRLFWQDGNLMGENLALQIEANKYVLGLGSVPGNKPDNTKPFIHVWYSDYHPDGGQLFYSPKVPFVANLAPPVGDDIKPEDFTAYYFEGGTGLYIHPGVWHNSVYIAPEHGSATVRGRQGKVHARISVRWVEEFQTVLRVPLTM